MGNISNIWYLKGGGKSWAETKCGLDDCYSIPFIPDEDVNLYLQADIPQGYTAEEVWLCDMDGNRLQELLAFTESKLILGEQVNKLIFHMPTDSYACGNLPCEGCTATLNEEGNESWYEDYMSGVNNVQVTFINTVTSQTYDVTDINAPLPTGWVRLAKDKFKVPCDLPVSPPIWNVQWVTDDPGGNHTQGWPQALTEETIPDCGPALKCWYLEIPLIGMESGEEDATLASEPFYCPECEATVKISSDYCRSKWDIFGGFLFNTEGIPGTQTGDLTLAKNDFRIQAVLKKMPSLITSSRNVKCATFSQKVQQRYKLQGSIPADFPDYMVNIIESIFAGKKVYIDGDEYISNSEQIFSERSTNGRSAKRLDLELVKCEKKVVFDCSCVEEAFDCSEVNIEATLTIVPAPNAGYGVDRSYIHAELTSITGGTGPYTISNWSEGNGVTTPNSDIIPFSDSATANIFRRNLTHLGPATPGLSITVKITDANGCEKVVGNSINLDDLRCVGYNGSFSITNVTDTTFMVTGVLPNTYDTYDIIWDNAGTIVILTAGVASSPFVQTGLTPNTQYIIYIRQHCNSETNFGWIGPITITTLP